MLESLKSLVLNYSYEPLQFCSAKHAIVMVLSGRAEEVESDGYIVRSPTTAFPLPAVIRTLKLVRKNRNNKIAFSKKNILRRDESTCQYCGEKYQSMTVDHIFPKSKGGKEQWENVVVACKPCNLRKGSKTLVEANMQLLRPPVQPQYPYFHFSVPTGSSTHLKIWQKYLPKKILCR
ncbi:MAG: HNH endonuclease [Nitrospinae bacterium CG11_big_fil_rev_8_21_14_0_20_45_15]|nr:MAG: HNH endonuclease [Nitrospinae bacterium CG11_big_fil_rev_8_21_14_0_20_45_15]